MCILHFDNERQNVANYVAMRVPDQCEQSSPCNCVSILHDVNQNMTAIRIRSIAWNMFAQNSFHFVLFKFEWHSLSVGLVSYSATEAHCHAHSV